MYHYLGVSLRNRLDNQPLVLVFTVIIAALIIAIMYRAVVPLSVCNQHDKKVEKSAARFWNKIVSPFVYVRRLFEVIKLFRKVDQELADIGSLKIEVKDMISTLKALTSDLRWSNSRLRWSTDQFRLLTIRISTQDNSHSKSLATRMSALIIEGSARNTKKMSCLLNRVN
jgi:hypothetical protein